MSRFETKPARLMFALSFWLVFNTPAFSAEPKPVKIPEVRRLDETVAQLGGEGDNWHMSWAGDDRVVAGVCEGNANP